jgi:hypothetical protein
MNTKWGIGSIRKTPAVGHQVQLMAAGLAGLAIGFSASIVAPALGVDNSLTSSGPTTQLPENAGSKTADDSQAVPASTDMPFSLEVPTPTNPVEPPATPTPAPVVVVKPTPTVSPTAVVTPTRLVTPAPVDALSSTPEVASLATQESSAPAPAPTQAPSSQQSTEALAVGTVSVTQVLPGIGIGEAVLQWTLVNGGTDYRIYKTGSIRPRWRLFYVYPPSVTSITIFDQPGSIALYKIMAVVNGKEKFVGEVIYRPIS